ncbi:UNVERIFIED_CONTAM: Alpha-1,6-mannosyl-glycoprotein 2-beta-N-acetylglucosaminyltransferase [Siphonaria sp. JEL0065]|nr:Alpha-1,6-mannosyl-glycoprotein 2-beta-N-acetylglucosaminyltransferase [Siphonaria sp. JEL0065]
MVSIPRNLLIRAIAAIIVIQFVLFVSLLKTDSLDWTAIVPGPPGPVIEDCLGLLPEPKITCIQTVNRYNLKMAKPPKKSKLAQASGLQQPYVPIVIMAHKRPLYMRNLMKSLRDVDGINETMLIVSHDGYVKEIDDAVAELSPIPYINIYHPESREFLKGTTLDTDFFKHGAARRHYWWMWNSLYKNILPSLFPKLNSTYAVTLEEDHIVSRDVYYLLLRLLQEAKKTCKDCFSVNLGVIDGPAVDRGSPDYAIRKSLTHNAGLTFSTEMFNRFITHALEWCEFDEYNWDWGIFRMTQDRILPGYTLLPVHTRVEHVGSCGMHHKAEGNCEKLMTNVEEKWRTPMNARLKSSVWLDGPLEVLNERPDNRNISGKMEGHHGWRTKNALKGANYSTYDEIKDLNNFICLRVAFDPLPL